MAAGVLYEGGRSVKTHGLVVEQTSDELGGSVRFEPGAGISEQRETHGVRFGKSVEREVGGGFD